MDRRAPRTSAVSCEEEGQIVATIAFGMASTSPTCACRPRPDPPENIEAYYQKPAAPAATVNLPKRGFHGLGCRAAALAHRRLDRTAGTEAAGGSRSRPARLLQRVHASRRMVPLDYFGENMGPAVTGDVCLDPPGTVR